MNHSGQLIVTSISQALQELRVNKLRTFLSLLGITIGIFCIIAVLTVVDSMKNNIKQEMATLGSDVLYIGRWPWMDEGGEYKWWEFWRRPSMSIKELRAIENNVPSAQLATLCFSVNGQALKHHDQEISGISVYAVTENFDRLQNIEIADGRYLSLADLNGGTNNVVIGDEAYRQLFPGNTDPKGEVISLKGKKFTVVGVMKKVGQNMAGFDFDEGVVIPYYSAAALFDLSDLSYDPFLIIKSREGSNLTDMKYEVEGALRQVRKVKPAEQNNFAINQLSQISERLDLMFGTINIIGWVIAGFSLLVGGFGIANIMFVTVKERTKVIGLKKAVGARPGSILMEFLVEAVTLCLTGGLVGILVVLMLSMVLNYGFDFPITLSPKNFFIGISISAMVGVLAGFIPARAASKLDPVVAIRSH
ncbi:MAG TPA: ABC transporter permease [Flavipsychrobacter sp.]|nr:ABC transporter permease [Flavipsychrobacter sp.]